jgi:transcription antitermination factor NusG
MYVAPTHSVDSCAETRWFAVKVRSRCEDAIADVLRGKLYEVLAPSYTELRRYSDRVRKVRCALFPGYVFVAMDPEKMLRLVSTEGVSYVVRTGTGVEPLSAEEIRAIKALCRMGAEQSQSCKPCAYLRIGQRVRIEVGPLAGLEGVLVRVRDIERIVVTVESLHSSVSVEIGHTRIRVLDGPLEAGNGEVSRQNYGTGLLRPLASQLSHPVREPKLGLHI